MISLLQKYLNEGRLSEAEGLLLQILKKTPNDFLANHTLGVIMGLKGSHAEASAYFLRAIKVKPNDPQANLNLAISLLQEKRLDESIKYYKKAIDYFPGRIDIKMDYAKILIQLSEFKLASAMLQKVVGLDPNYAEAWYCLGNTNFLNGMYEEAIKNFNKATALAPDYSSAWNGNGTALAALKMYDEAAISYQRAVEIDTNYSEAWYNLGNLYLLISMPKDAIECFNRALEIRSEYAEAWLNKGVAFRSLQLYQDAADCFQNALEITPNYIEAWNNLSVLGIDTLNDELAFFYSRQALSHDEQNLSALDNAGTALANLRRFPEAVANYKKILDVDPYFAWTLGNLIHNQMKTCDWSRYFENLQKIQEGIYAQQLVTVPFPVLALVDDPVLHLKAAKNWTQYKHKEGISTPQFSINSSIKNEKIHIGYFSADFRNHPGAHLIIGLLEAHDKEKFEITAFSFGPDTQDEMRERLEKAFDRFIDIRHLSDQDAAALSREMGVDIAIDRNGHTRFNRQGIFAHRAAPIQVGYLGYPCTTGAPWIDYLVADKVLIPDDQRENYSEKIIYMPHTYQPNDRKRVVSEKIFSRTELGLPENGFVFGSFNNNYKITPDVFDGWMRILSRVENSVLWILADNHWASENLQKEAEKRGVGKERIIFAQRMPMPDHLARHRCADLFLDTSPYGAHTTASDALWVGLPVLTLEGKSFPARVCASLLKAIDLDGLIAKIQQEYEDLAVELANSPAKLQRIKEKLEQARMNTPLFDAELYAKNLERAFQMMQKNYQDGGAPLDIHL